MFLHCKKAVVSFLETKPAVTWGLWWGVLSEVIGQEPRWSRSSICQESVHSGFSTSSPTQGSAFTLNTRLWLLDWRSPSKRLFSPLLRSLCSHLFLHVVEINCSLIKTLPSTFISYWTTIIIMTCCIFLLLKVNGLCVSQGIYAGPTLVGVSKLWMRPLGSPWKPNMEMTALCVTGIMSAAHMAILIFSLLHQRM